MPTLPNLDFHKTGDGVRITPFYFNKQTCTVVMNIELFPAKYYVDKTRDKKMRLLQK